jgi:hypothetical protein
MTSLASLAWTFLSVIAIQALVISFVVGCSLSAKRADEESDALLRKQLRREARDANIAREQAQDLHRLNPCRATRLLMVHAEAICDLAAAVQAEDREMVAAFTAQLETIKALRAIPDPPASPATSWHRDKLEAARWN